MSDIIDDANDAADLFRDADINRARSKAAPEQEKGFDGKHCVEPDCGIELPAERLKMKRVRCVDCQQRKESKQRRGL